ncbi:MAG TPA: lysylphosphatidylglycerol synthase transmembrane domain-containing protein [Deltaproteobacteria bacterium]|nr:lysylphosphatidylglycerol synthase transmembrane domain-containing protein [Deltaproteobacteria bacterium]HPP80523.1 lysylphosphatidylglycerol synthase transmembrane domain-containing protein [Deltaproteobacteria bacterium]
MTRRRKIILSLAAGIVFSAAALRVSFANVPMGDLAAALSSVDPLWVAVSIVLGYASYIARTLRWLVILRPVKKVPFLHAYHPVMITFMMNSIFPGRIGELARPAVLFKRDGVEFSKTLATVALERVFDFFSLIALFVVIMGSVSIDPGISIDFNGYTLDRAALFGIKDKAVKSGVVFLVCLAVLLTPWARRAIARVVSWIPHAFFMGHHTRRAAMAERFRARAETILDNVAHGFSSLRRPSAVLSSVVLSFMVWGFVFLALYALSLGFPSVSIDLVEAGAVTIMICFFIMLPSVPGFWGLWEAGGIYGLMLFGVGKVDAAGLTVAFHVFQIVPVIVLGLVSAWVTGIDILRSGFESRP